MLNATTRMPKVTRSNEPTRLKITVKNNVDKPIIMARVPTIDRRSFQVLTFLYTNYLHRKQLLIFFALKSKVIFKFITSVKLLAWILPLMIREVFRYRQI